MDYAMAFFSCFLKESGLFHFRGWSRPWSRSGPWWGRGDEQGEAEDHAEAGGAPPGGHQVGASPPSVHFFKTLPSAFNQCCGSETGSTGSTCFLGLPDPDSLVRGAWIRIRILLSSCKNRKKKLDYYYFLTLFDFLFLKNDVNVASKSIKQKKLC